ncbi:PREDICTED: uncharacterized protein LOC109580659 [Amphimedon queenslandica]|uniref:Uncharacterized protein n=1 Tax=Amphimedon queenslandica TaxID=400682 RepID=A0A1X7VDU6_AMPQE|nr:PREDICTED: uncharacterized protein LOC109580659 [Amphimedon queenslandica]XP_019849629.1 PREDICTED: uncharacterized protein LOC109580659 [Amphimedon queenslandica]XP_019849630.1 PREDICTED: uncharacterized protein LOC109580659 [Amphimedon queenslandica]|eukprot:XP_019849628.1 PREDICTED: uncharacterized protein LOC109580659 [Amphimedon queenslandica]
MFTISAIDPALIILVNIYADQFSDRQDTSVYNNGVMQVSVFVSVNYNGEASDDEIIKYVQNKVVIYSLNYGENVQWQKSTIDNGFLHDTEHDANESPSIPPKKSDIRAVLYFTVPGGTAEGEHKWIAKLDGQQTSTKTALTITVEPFEISAGNLELVKKVTVNCAVLYVLKYKKGVFPIAQKLRNCIDFKGMKFSGTGANSWVSMVMSNKGYKLGAFVEYRETSNIQIGKAFHEYSQDELVIKGSGFDLCQQSYAAEIFSLCIDDTLALDPADVDAAWNEGVVMLQVREDGLGIWCMIHLDVEENDFVFQDTFGGRVEVNINWDAGDSWGIWTIRSAKVVYP